MPGRGYAPPVAEPRRWGALTPRPYFLSLSSGRDLRALCHSHGCNIHGRLAVIPPNIPTTSKETHMGGSKKNFRALYIKIAKIATRMLSINNIIMSRMAFFIAWYLFIVIVLSGIFFCCGAQECFPVNLLWFLVTALLLLLVHSLMTIASTYRTKAKLLQKGMKSLKQSQSQKNSHKGDDKC